MKADGRYSRQILFEGIGAKGQARLRAARVLVVGCGALGSAHVEMLARAGVGCLRVADRDFVEESNLQRQTLFTESDAQTRTPKAIAAQTRVREINANVRVEAEVMDVSRANIERLIEDCALVLDGTDNFATRYLINDACVKHQVNWIYGAAVGSYGVTMTIRPRMTQCLRCVFEELPTAGSAPTCDTAGVIMSVTQTIAALQVAEALKLLVGDVGALHRSLMQIDLWRNEWRRIKLGAPREDCPTCGALGEYAMLDAVGHEATTNLCGRDAVQVTPSPHQTATLDLEKLAARLRVVGEVKVNEYLLRVQAEECELTVFRDGRAIIRGTDDETRARALYARYVGN